MAGVQQAIEFVRENWLSILLLIGGLVAVIFVYKHKEKFEKNTFE